MKRDESIYEGITELGRIGVFAEPAGATAFAGMKKAIAMGIISAEDDALVVNTGSGLKDVRSAMIAAGQAPVIAPTMEALETYLNEK